MGASSPHVLSYVKEFNEQCKKIKRGDRCLPRNNYICIAMYKQIISEQRYTINVLLQKKMSKKDIAKAINVDLSTIYRELKRNSGSRNHYNWETAEANARRKKRRTPGNRRISQEVREEGEAINARKAMVRLCSTLGVNLEDILNESEQKKEYVFNVGCDHLLKELFFMCSEKILGDGEIWYKEKNSHISLELTPSQYAELFTYFDFHKENFKKELKATRKRLLLAYLLKHNIYVGNDDGTDKELSSEERRNAWKTLQMVDGLENVSYLKSLEDK